MGHKLVDHKQSKGGCSYVDLGWSGGVIDFGVLRLRSVLVP